ncbi:M28 family peptidase [Halochromatium sp.]
MTTHRRPFDRQLLPLLLSASIAASAVSGAASSAVSADASDQQTAEGQAASNEARLLSNTRQLIFEGRRSGEGYFSADGRTMIFQSEREPGNPFYQIYLLDLETGDTKRVSTGTGKTTCAWIHPDGQRVLFSSTHLDPAARDKQQEELEKRASGQGSRYSWSFDPSYEIFEADTDGNLLRQLTDAEGYDAEGSWSPDGEQIVFASNRHAYSDPGSAEQQAALAQDPSRFMELYIMDADGGNLRRLTDHDGYDGGPFFSADGERIVWRRFEANGKVAEIWTMRADGSDQRQITNLGVMSWAPFFHPSGDYIVFANNAQGYANFELYLVDSQGQSRPVRVTDSAGFDGLPVFTPDGERLAWASSRTANKQAQIFIADWDDAAARELLGLPPAGTAPDATSSAAPETTPPSIEAPPTETAISAEDLRRHVEILTSEPMAGRRTGTAGERLASEYVAKVMQQIGLQPAAKDSGWFQPYELTSAVTLGDDNRLEISGLKTSADGGTASAQLDQEWRPLAFSGNGQTGPANLVFAGYGMVAPGNGEQPAYDSYQGLDVEGRWVLALRYLPENVSPERRQYLSEYANLRFKAMVAREQGAAGLLIASGPSSGVKEELIALTNEAGAGGGSLPVISISDALADQLLAAAGTSLAAQQQALDGGDAISGLELPEVAISASVDLAPVRTEARNVLGRLPTPAELTQRPTQSPTGRPTQGPAQRLVVIGAHLDHIGMGEDLDSRDGEPGLIHPGADDNASGVAALLEIAEWLVAQQQAGKLELEHDLLFAAWSGEELGRLGSSAFVEQLGDAEEVIGYINLDMVGRLDKALYVQGVGSSPVWRRELERRNVPVGLPLRLQDDAYLPTDTTSFYLAGAPVLNFFTGVHADYNTSRDTADKIDYEGLARIARLTSLVGTAIASNPEPPAYVAQEKPSTDASRANLRAYLGTIPAYSETDLEGVLLDGVAENGPADKGGLRAGDLVVAIAGRRIENIYDYTYALNALKVGDPVAVTVNRDGAEQALSVVPAPRE